MKCNCGHEFEPVVQYRHRLLCGDSRDPDDVKKVVGKDKVNGIMTSPPYAMQRKAQYGGVEPDAYVEWWDKVQANMRAVLAEDGSFFLNIKPHCKDGQRVLYVFDLVLAMVRRWGWRFVDELCWTHQGYPGGWNNRFKNEFEPVYHFCVGKIKFIPGNVLEELGERHHYHIKARKEGRKWAGDDYHHPNSQSGFGNMKYYRDDLKGARPGNVLDIKTGSNSQQAATFPLRLPTFFIRAYSDPNDIWLDPFTGSGTTILAAHQEGRRGFGIEKLEKYAAVTLERLAAAGLGAHKIKEQQ